MTIKRLTKEDIRKTAGVLNPVGHIVLAFEDDAVAAEAVAALRAAGFADEDILAYTAAEATPRLRERVHTASQAAGFGYEITLMRRYLAYAEEGAGWLDRVRARPTPRRSACGRSPKRLRCARWRALPPPRERGADRGRRQARPVVAAPSGLFEQARAAALGGVTPRWR